MTDLFMSDLFITNTKDRPCISPRGVTTGGFGGVSPPPPIFRNGTLVGQKLRKGRAKPGTKLKGGCDTPPKLDWQGKSSGLAGQIIWIGRAMKDLKFRILFQK